MFQHIIVHCTSPKPSSLSSKQLIKSHDELRQDQCPHRIQGYALHAFSTSRVKDSPARSFAFASTLRTCFPSTTSLGEIAVYSGRRSQQTSCLCVRLIDDRSYLISPVMATIDHYLSCVLHSDTHRTVLLIPWISQPICRHLMSPADLDHP